MIPNLNTPAGRAAAEALVLEAAARLKATTQAALVRALRQELSRRAVIDARRRLLQQKRLRDTRGAA